MFFSEVIAHKTIVRNKAVFPECLIFDCSNTLKAGFSYCSALQQMFLFALHLLNKLLETSPGKTHFSKVSKLFGCNSGDVIDFFVSSKHRPLQAPNLTVILIFILFTTYQTSFTGKAGRKFRTRNVFGTFDKRAPGAEKYSSPCNSKRRTAFDVLSVLQSFNAT